MNSSGLIFDIKKFAIHDGPGIRTTVFLKGCPLRCIWCHNPESQEMRPELSFQPEKCIGCGWCFQQCPVKAHYIKGGKHVFERGKCIGCSKCTERCCTGALTMLGKKMTVDEVIAEVIKDKPFYEESHGGMTVSGGEPMMQFEFTRDLLIEAKKRGLHNCLDTCGSAPWEHYREILPDVDLFLYDLKETDPERHEEYTGTALLGILDNLYALDRAGAKIILRCPIIPGLNDREEHFRAIVAISEKLQHPAEINLLPYHPLGKAKLQSIGRKSLIDGKSFADEAAVKRWIKLLQSQTTLPVSKG